MSNHNSSKNQEIKRKFVEREVIACQSMLVEELINKKIDGFSYEDVENFFIDNSDKIDELKEKIEELENQVTEIEEELEENEETNTLDNSLIADRNSQVKNLQKEIETIESNIEELENEQENPQEIYEWWLINKWFADKLRQQNEPILDNDYGIWWGRTCTGQAILLDGVISEICEEMEILEGQKYEW